MSIIYVKSTTGSDANNGTTWALAKATLAGARAIAVAGDIVYVSQLHAESTAAAVSLNFAGTRPLPISIICANDAAMPPTASASTATVTTTGASNLTINGSNFVSGTDFICGNGFNFANFNIAAGTWAQHFSDCNLTLADTHPSSLFSVGTVDGGASSQTKFTNCGFKLLCPTSDIRLVGRVNINGGSFLTGSLSTSGIAFFLGGTSKDSFFTCENFDLSVLAASINIFNTPGSVQVSAVIKNCKLPAAWTGKLVVAAFATPACRYEMYNCSSGSTNYNLWIEDFSGSVRSETVVVKTGGASDGTTPLAWKMTGNANTNEVLGHLASGEIAIWNETTGVAKTVTVDILHDSLTALTNADVWLEVSELGTTGSQLGVGVSSKRADPLVTATTVPTSTATWTTTGITNVNKQKMSVTFTPANKGPFMCRVVLGLASKVIYVDPVAQVL